MNNQAVVVCFLLILLTTVVSSSSAWQQQSTVTQGRQQWQHRLSSIMTRSSAVVPPETSPLAPHTFAGMVERGLVEKFGTTSAINRVLQSWRWSEVGYEHREFVGSPQDPSEHTAEATATTSNCHQYAHSYVPGLTVKTFWTLSDFPWTQKIQARYDDIRDEFQTVTADMDKLTRAGNNIWAGALTEDASSYGTGWKTLVLMNRGRWDPVNVNLFPKAAKAVYDSGCPAVEVFFASMKGNSDIKSHSDFTNFVLTSHLALDIPESGNNKCRLTIGDETRQWINGDMMVFDTSIMHSAVNESDKTRYILMIRLWHPDLTKTEREALQYIYDCLDYPELTQCETSNDRRHLQQQIDATRVFPLSSGKAGFGSSRSNKATGSSSSSSSSNKKKKKSN